MSNQAFLFAFVKWVSDGDSWKMRVVFLSEPTDLEGPQVPEKMFWDADFLGFPREYFSWYFQLSRSTQVINLVQ